MNNQPETQNDKSTMIGIILLMILFIIQRIVTPLVSDITSPANRILMEQRQEVIQEEQQQAQDSSIADAIQPNILLGLSAAFILNFILIMFYSRKSKSEDIELMSGTCAHFEIKKPEIL
ncbi:MAG: hypothetical protein K6B69_04720 [Lachnospiraceae bacterium]|nr:hypothetical protein [Lachnospiraceae bacterium]